jgi:SAM-dependent methyltransferase
MPYLASPLRERFDGWLAATLDRFLPPLSFTELRRGVQALSVLYVERRATGELAARAREGVGKRAALATYYAALHFLTTHHALRMVGTEALFSAREVVDLGCGTGAVGAALATLAQAPPEILGIDRSGWALEEARLTWSAFGVDGRVRRSELPDAVPNGRKGVAMTCGWAAGELEDSARDGLLRRLIAALRRGSPILVLEPLAGRASPWWTEWAKQLAPWGVRDELIRVAIERPSFIRDMDKAARLDHQVIGARVLVGRRPTAE